MNKKSSFAKKYVRREKDVGIIYVKIYAALLNSVMLLQIIHVLSLAKES